MFVYGAIIPHSPFLAPGAHKDKQKMVVASENALRSVGEELRLLDVESILLVSVHGERYADALSIAVHDPYVATMREFGDLKTRASYAPDLRMIDAIGRGLRTATWACTTTTNDVLDYASSVPLLALEPYIASVKITVITPPIASGRDLVNLGDAIREVIDVLPQRVAVLCVAELSHRLSELSPGGVHPKSSTFDAAIRGAFADGNSLPLLKPTAEEVAEVGGEELDAIRLFWGILSDTAYRVEERAYEAPFGVGYLTLVTHVH